MDMRKLLKTAALAAAFAAPAAVFAEHSHGDIYDIVPCDAEGNTLTNASGVTAWASFDEPITNAGQSVYFKIRLARTSLASGSGLWMLEHTGSNSEAVDWAVSPLRVGVFARGANELSDTATLVDIADRDGNYTELVFRYDTKGGDFAMPLVLMGENRQPAISYKIASGDDTTGFYFYNTNKWRIVNTESADAPNFWYRTPASLGPIARPSDTPGDRWSDMTLQSAGIYIKTIDFGKKWEIDAAKAAEAGTNAIWRSVHQDDTATVGDTPILEKVMAYSNDTVVTLYLWSDDDSAVRVEGGVATTITNRFDNGNPVTSTVYMRSITVSGSDPTAAFQLRGVSETGGAAGDGMCNIVLSPYPGYVFVGGSGMKVSEPVKCYITRPVKCAGPLPATLVVEREDGSRDFTMTAGVGDDYKNYKAVLNVRLTQAYTEDMTVTIAPGFTETPAYDGDWRDYVAFSTSSAYPTGNDTAAPSVTIRAGQLVADQKIYVFAKRADAHTAQTGKQISFAPTVDDAGAAGFLTVYTSAYATIYSDSPVIVRTQADESDGIVSGTCNVAIPFMVQVEDIYAATQDRTTGYIVQWKKEKTEATWTTLEGRYYYGAEGYLYRLAEATNESGTVTYYYDENATAVPPQLTYSTANAAGYTSALRIVSPVKYGADRTATVEFAAVISDPKSATMRTYLEETPDVETRVFTESYQTSAAIDITLSEPNGETHPLFAFLVPQNSFDIGKLETGIPFIVGQTNIVEGETNKLEGLQIDSGLATYKNAGIKFLDGSDSQRFTFRVVILDEKYWDGVDMTKVRGDYGSESYTVTVKNVEPSILYIEMNGAESPSNGGKYTTRLPVGIEREFTAFVDDPGTYDLVNTNGNKNAASVGAAGDLFRVRWRVYLDDEIYEDPTYIYGEPEANPFKFTFTQAGTWRIECQVRDKDMTRWSETSYSVYVDVLNQPQVNINNHLYGGGLPDLYENAPGATNVTVSLDYFDNKFAGRVFVALKVKSSGAGTSNPGILKLDSQYAWGDAQGGPFELDSDGNRIAADQNADYYILEFNKNLTRRTLAFTELDGTDNRFTISAYVAWSENNGEIDGLLPTSGMKAIEYYIADTITGVNIVNVEPTVTMQPQNDESNRWTVAGGRATNRTISWRVNADIGSDFTNSWKNASSGPGVLVAISGAANPTNIYVTEANTAGTFVPDFQERTGEQLVTVTISDKDSQFAQSFYYYYFVKPSKFLKLAAVGPGSGAGATAISDKYKDAMRTAKSYGRGHVWVNGAGGATWTSVDNFTITWNCAGHLSEEIWAFGYKTNAIYDAGDLDGGKDIGILENGSRSANSTVNTNNCYKYTLAKDSFFYCWIQHDPAATDAESAGTLLKGQISPEYAGNPGKSIIAMPEDEDEVENYQQTIAEAIFTLELYGQDNLGDINADGIPDKMALKNSWGEDGNLNLIELAGGDRIENDLMDLADKNPANDFLPGVVAQVSQNGGTAYVTGSGSSYAPSGLDFTTILHIRGFHKGLNDNDQYFTVSDPDFGEDEAMAYSNWLVRTDRALYDDEGAMTNVWDLNVWSPEPDSLGDGTGRRMDPTRLSGDGDKFPDGWEYFFWYQAKVWWECWQVYEATMAEWGEEEDWDDDQKALAKQWRKCLGKPRTGQRYVFERFDIENITSGIEIAPEEVMARFNPCRRLTAGQLADDPDFDDDGLSDLEELAIGTNPCHWDTDGDSMCDSWEVLYSLNPRSAKGSNGAAGNPDGDWMAYATTESMIYAVKDAAGDWVTDPDYDIFADDGQTIYAITAMNTDDYDDNGGVIVRDTVVGCFEFKPAYRDGLALLYGVNKLDEQAEAGDGPGEDWGLPMVRDIERHDEVTIDAETAIFKEKKFVLVHDQVKSAYGFDPRTGWCALDGLCGTRWDENFHPSAAGGQGAAVNTKAYTNFDEYLLLEYVREFLRETKGYNYTTDEGEIVRFDLDDEGAWAIIRATTTNPNVILRTETSSDDDDDDSSSSSTSSTADGETTTSGDTTTSTIASHGADTDGDGIPDGWELYNSCNPLLTPYNDGGQHLSTSRDNDGLNLLAEYSGTDSCNAYTNRFDSNGNLTYYECDSITKNHPGKGTIVAGWFNKFFPTDPNNADTDGDGVRDGVEGGSWSEDFYNDGVVWEDRIFTFNYGSKSDNPGTLCFRGGGMNPCTIDTDADGLPDGWELQHAGLVANASTGKCTGYNAGVTLSDATLIADGLFASSSSTNSTGSASAETESTEEDSSAELYIAGGMDATWSGDNTTDIASNGTWDGRTGTRRDVDFDHDGLENAQEYLVQAMRHFRYDDITTPLMGRLLTEGAYNEDSLAGTHSQAYLGFVRFGMGGAGETATAAAKAWYGASAVEEYTVTTGVRRVTTDEADENGDYIVREIPVTATRTRVVTDMAPEVERRMNASGGRFSYGWTEAGWRKLGYLATPPRSFDRCLLGASAGVTPPLYMLPAAGSVKVSGTAPYGFAAGYASCDPRLADTDGDGMDDYYEMFHGLNPLLGSAPSFDDNAQQTRSSAWQDNAAGKHGDIVALAYSVGSEGGDTTPFYNAYYNEWIYPTFDRNAALNGQPQSSGAAQIAAPAAYDPVLYPWTMGSPLADADGDGIRNDEERVLANIANPLPTHTDPSPAWFTERTSKSSYTWQYYAPGETASRLTQGFSLGEYLFDFEESEGYDTDNDFTPDSFEVIKMATPYSDPLRFTDPVRRQAFYLPGSNAYAVTFDNAMRESGEADLLRQFTVELWVWPEKSGEAQTILERACLYEGDAVTKDSKAVRANFRIGLSADGVIYGMFDNSDAKESGADEPVSCQKVDGGKIGLDTWSHVALTFDGSLLSIYVDGVLRSSARTTLVPANGIYMAVQNPAQASTFPDMPNPPNYSNMMMPTALFIGARPIRAPEGGEKAMYPFYPYTLDAESLADASTHEESFGNVREFFKGYVDEVRIWDGARSGADILADKDKAMTFDEVAANREEVYAVWAKNGTRNNNDGMPMLPPELIYHYSFEDIPGAADAGAVAQRPTGFEAAVANAAANDYISNEDISTEGLYPNIAELKKRADDDESDGIDGSLKIGWWENCLLRSSVYQDTRIVPWIQNTVAHLPMADGSSVDTFMYGDNYSASYTPASEHGLAWYAFPNTAMPYANSLAGIGIETRIFRAEKLAAQRGSDHSDHAARARYVRRSWFAGSTDLIPLGGAFAMRCAEMWDGAGAASPWENAGGEDGNGDGIPDWYEEYARNNYAPDLDPASALSWNTLVHYPNGAAGDPLVPAGVAYMLDLNRGMLPDGQIHAEYKNTADKNNNNIADWWEQLFGLEDCDPDDDYDSDGLSNYAEYMLSFGDAPYGIESGFPYLDPTVPRTGVEQKVVDYFLPGPESDITTADGGTIAGGQYLGEIATDHDFIENWWEIQYGRGYANARIYDPDLDKDGDGWDNFSENRAATWGASFPGDYIDRYYNGTEVGNIKAYPRPAIGIKATYFGTANDVTGASLVVRVWKEANGLVDATFSAQAGVQDGEMLLGQYLFDTELHGILHPGSIVPGTGVAFRKRSVNAEPTYYWTLFGVTSSGKQADYLAAVSRYGAQNVNLEYQTDEFNVFARTRSHAGGNTGDIILDSDEAAAPFVVGSIDFRTGEWTIDLGKVTGNGVTLDEMMLQVTYTYRIGDEWPQTLWFSNPDSGFVRQGQNTIEAFFDLDGNGAYTAGEPYGVVEGVNIGWHKTGPITLELKDTSPVAPRIDIAGNTADRYAISGDAGGVTFPSGDNEGAAAGDGEDEPGTGVSRTIRILRTGINGVETQARHLVTKTLATRDRAYLNEADICAETIGVFDLDWQHLASDAARLFGADNPVKYATYAVEEVFSFADGTQTNVLVCTFRKDFTMSRPMAGIVSPAADMQVYTTSPALAFTSGDGTVTAFEVQIARIDGAATNVVYDSGARLLPGRTSETIAKNAVYRFTPPVYVDAPIGGADGVVFEDGATYCWRVALMNAAHPASTLTEDGWSPWAQFTLDIGNEGINPQIPTGYGMVGATVRYFGSNAAAFEAGKIIVEAHASADFTGRPLAQVRVADISQLGDINDTSTVNALMRGIEPQTVWLVAWVDANDNGVRDAWETWGYANMVGTTRVDIYTPAGVAVTESMTSYNSAVIYLEDTDLNRNETLDYTEDEEAFAADVSAADDPDGDGLTTEVENQLGLNPNSFDADGDGMPDGWEVWTDGVVDPQTVDADQAGEADDVMAYAEIPAALVTVENLEDGTTALWAMPATLDWKTTGPAPVLGETPQVGDRFATADDIAEYGFLQTYRYGDIYGVGTAPSADGGWQVVAVDAGASVALVHAQVYHYFGFNQFTCVADANAVNTKQMTALDKYLVVRYLDALGLVDEDEVNKKRLWDAWTLQPGEKDRDLDGILDGWELYTMFKNAGDAITTIDPWNYDDRETLHDGLRLIDEWDRGNLPTDPWTADTDGDGVSDAMAFAYHIKGARLLDDDDGDGLSNYAEYLLSERFNLGVKFDPDKAYSASAFEPDYFYRTGQIYVGEVFSDYDQVLDSWEDAAGSAIAGRYTWDARRDGDEDGWNAYDEALASGDEETWVVVGTKTNTVEVVDDSGATTNATVEVPVYGYAGRPTPTITLKLRYNGTRKTTGESSSDSSGESTNGTQAATTPIVVETYTDVNNADESRRLIARDAKFARSIDGNLQLQPLTARFREPDYGYVKGGKNMIVAFCDFDGDGEFTPGEPVGVATGVEIGWRGGYAEIELTDTSVVITRLTIGEEIESSGESTVYDEDGTNPETVPVAPSPSTDRKVVWGDADGDHHALWTGSDTGGAYEQVRVVRTLVNGENIADYEYISNEVVLDKILTIGQKPYLFEGDIYARGDFDLDWDTLASNVVEPFARNGKDVTNMTYRIVLGNGTIALDETNNLFSVAITRSFDAATMRQRPREVSPGAEGAAVFASHPTFKWSMDGHDTYTAFRLEIREAGNDGTAAGGDPVWDSGIRIAPPRDSEGNYTFEADAYAGCELEAGKSYSWRVTMFNAKFKTAYWSNASATFLMATPSQGGVYGELSACVKYFGPDAALDASDVIVEAYASPDFTGRPLARAKVAAADLAKVSSNSEENEANVVLPGVERGATCYIRAWLDMKNYGESGALDAFEAWGSACGRNRAIGDPYRPSPFVFDFADGSERLVEVFVEDVDSNGNRLPDTWEMAVNGGSLYETAAPLDTAIAGSIPVNSSLASSLQAAEETATSLSAPLDTLVVATLGTRAGAALAMGVDPAKVATRAGASGPAIEVECEIEGVEIEALEIDGAGNLTLAISGESAAAAATGYFAEGSIATVPAQVTVEVYRKATLAEEGWGEAVATATVRIGEGATAQIPLAGAAEGVSGFFKVVVADK